MVDEHSNATAYRRTADAFRAGDLASLEALIDPDVIWHVPGSHTMAGDVIGRPNLIQWLRELNGRGFQLTEEDVFGNDDHVCALSIMGATRRDFDTRTRVVSIFRYRDGRQLERWFYPDDPEAWNMIFA